MEKEKKGPRALILKLEDDVVKNLVEIFEQGDEDKRTYIKQMDEIIANKCFNKITSFQKKIKTVKGVDMFKYNSRIASLIRKAQCIYEENHKDKHDVMSVTAEMKLS